MPIAAYTCPLCRNTVVDADANARFRPIAARQRLFHAVCDYIISQKFHGPFFARILRCMLDTAESGSPFKILPITVWEKIEQAFRLDSLALGPLSQSLHSLPMDLQLQILAEIPTLQQASSLCFYSSVEETASAARKLLKRFAGIPTHNLTNAEVIKAIRYSALDKDTIALSWLRCLARIRDLANLSEEFFYGKLSTFQPKLMSQYSIIGEQYLDESNCYSAFKLPVCIAIYRRDFGGTAYVVGIECDGKLTGRQCERVCQLTDISEVEVIWDERGIRNIGAQSASEAFQENDSSHFYYAHQAIVPLQNFVGLAFDVSFLPPDAETLLKFHRV